jgi:hypothetical protein
MSSRPLAALASVVLAGLGLLFLLPDYASACSRAGGGFTERQVVENALSVPDYFVFSGEVVKIDSMPEAKYKATLRVFEVWNGPEHGTLQVITLDPALCGTPFKEGQEYLVYAYGKEEPFKVDDGVTKSLRSSKAAEDLALLGKLGDGQKPKDGGDALTDTSGVVSVRAMIGMAGLAMAASLLVVVRLVRTG